MALVFTLVGISAAGFAAFWGISLFFQRYLYNEPADKLPLRAAVAGLLLGCFVTTWVYINTRADGENKYGVIHQFSPNDKSAPLPKFQAVRVKLDTNQKPVGEETVTFERQQTDKGMRYLPVHPVPAGEARPFAVTASGYYTSAILTTDANGQPVRYEAVMANNTYTGPKYLFQEKGGDRTIELTRGAEADPAEPLSVVVPSGGVVFLAILLNVLHLVIWVACFWPVLKFNLGHAIGLAVVFFALSTVILMPLLFENNKVTKVPTPNTPATTKS